MTFANDFFPIESLRDIGLWYDIFALTDLFSYDDDHIGDTAC